MFELKNTPQITDKLAIKAFLKDKTIRWRVKEGYFETSFPGEMRIQLITSEKCLILYFLNVDDSIRWVEIWDLSKFKTIRMSYSQKILFFSENLNQLGIKLLNLSVDLSDLSKSDPLKLCGLIENNNFYNRNRQMDAPWALVQIGVYKYVIQWSLLSTLVLKSPDQELNYFDVFQSVPIPIEFLHFGPVPYYHVDRFRRKLCVHYPTKKKDRRKPKEILCLPPLEKIYGFPLIDLQLTDDNVIVEVMNHHRSQWFVENILKDVTLCNDDTRDQMYMECEQTQ